MTTVDYAIVSFILGMIVVYFLAKALDRYRRKKIYFRAKAAEKRAMTLLEENGYRIIDKQPKKNIIYSVNGEKKQAYVKADFLAKKFFRKVVCEVKTGDNTRVTQALIRRQLLDYFYAYGVREVLLIDMEKEKIDRIVFEKQRNSYWAVPALFFLGFAVAYLVHYYI